MDTLAELEESGCVVAVRSYDFAAVANPAPWIRDENHQEDLMVEGKQDDTEQLVET